MSTSSTTSNSSLTTGGLSASSVAVPVDTAMVSTGTLVALSEEEIGRAKAKQQLLELLTAVADMRGIPLWQLIQEQKAQAEIERQPIPGFALTKPTEEQIIEWSVNVGLDPDSQRLSPYQTSILLDTVSTPEAKLRFLVNLFVGDVTPEQFYLPKLAECIPPDLYKQWAGVLGLSVETGKVDGAHTQGYDEAKAQQSSNLNQSY